MLEGGRGGTGCEAIRSDAVKQKKKEIPRLFLQNQVRLHKELDAQPQPTGRHAVHLLADAVPQIQPQVLALGSGELQAEVVHLNDAQLSANLERKEHTQS